MVTERAFITCENAISQMVQVFGFIRLGLMPNRRNGADNGPRSGIADSNDRAQVFQSDAAQRFQSDRAQVRHPIVKG
ncbi:hypothetical protein, partial [Bradyrhizobium iriomotense]|uniref:hypothetical protein n=1 Tax=Bradyrhizobium iriomotense TaxID=441950 RepID=UPI0024E04499